MPTPTRPRTIGIASAPIRTSRISRCCTRARPRLRCASRILAHLAREREPELADIRVVRGPADLDPMMPAVVSAFLTHVWSQASEATP